MTECTDALLEDRDILNITILYLHVHNDYPCWGLIVKFLRHLTRIVSHSCDIRVVAIIWSGLGGADKKIQRVERVVVQNPMISADYVNGKAYDERTEAHSINLYSTTAS